MENVVEYVCQHFIYAVSVFHILILNAGIVRNCNITFQVLCLFNVLCNSLSVPQNPNKSPIKSNSKPQSTLSKYWMDTIQEMYTRMRKAESRVRGLTYQKKLILLQLGGYEVTIIPLLLLLYQFKDFFMSQNDVLCVL